MTNPSEISWENSTLRTARENLSQSINLHQETGYKTGLAHSLLVLGRIFLEISKRNEEFQMKNLFEWEKENIVKRIPENSLNIPQEMGREWVVDAWDIFQHQGSLREQNECEKILRNFFGEWKTTKIMKKKKKHEISIEISEDEKIERENEKKNFHENLITCAVDLPQKCHVCEKFIWGISKLKYIFFFGFNFFFLEWD